MNMNKISLLVIACIFSIQSISFSQNNTLYNSTLIPQSHQANPAYLLPYKFYMNMPVVGSFNIAIGSTGFTLADALVSTDTTLTIDVDNIINIISDREYLFTNIDYQGLLVGFTINKKHQFSLGQQLHIVNEFHYSKDFLSFLWYGNGYEKFIGKDLNFSNLGLNSMVYSEYALHYSGKINDKISIGITPKILFGRAYINTLNSSFSFYTSPNIDTVSASASIEVNTAGLPSLLDTSGAAIDPLGIFTSSFGNMGFAADLGVMYKPIDKLDISASIINLGSISWKSNARTYYTNEASFSFSGIDINELLGSSSDTTGSDSTASVMDSVLQQLIEDFKLKEREEKFSTALPIDFYLGGQYHFNNYFSANSLFHGRIYAGKFTPSFTVGANATLKRILELSLSYTIMPRSFNNVGVGLAANLGPVQLYVVSDNILGLTRIDYTKYLNVRFGMNIVMKGKKKDNEEMEEPKVHQKTKPDYSVKKQMRIDKRTDTDKDGTMDFDDKCKDIAGIALFMGCPDTDKDSIEDKLDECPTDSGLAYMKGCPDADKDSIRDKDDHCPLVAGKAYLHGCPDKDNDSIKDEDDECPEIAGYLNGCPDTDNDSIADHKDLCPQMKGTTKAQGCPDRDDDGVTDSTDYCMDIAGPIEFMGCPDTDEDGVLNHYDLCPDQFGSIENFGCPLEGIINKPEEITK